VLPFSPAVSSLLSTFKFRDFKDGFRIREIDGISEGRFSPEKRSFLFVGAESHFCAVVWSRMRLPAARAGSEDAFSSEDFTRGISSTVPVATARSTIAVL